MSDLRSLFQAFTPESCVDDWVATEFGMPIDHLDPVAVNCAHSSLLMLDYKSGIRRWCVRFVHSMLFKWFMIVVILLNAIALALRDPGLQTNRALQNTLDVADYIFITFFTLELVMKVISYGLVVHPKSFLRHPWNILDSIVVVSGLVGLIVADGGSGVSVLRVVRVLRPLRAFNYIKTLRRLINRIIAAVPRLNDVFVLLIFLVWLFDVVGVHLFMGTLESHCYGNVTGTPFEGPNMTGLQRVRNDTLVCGSPGSQGRQCSSNGLNMSQVCIQGNSGSSYSFDNAVFGFLMAFKIVSRDNWTDDLRNLTNAMGPYVFFYFLLATLLVGYFSVNLFLAVLENVFTSKGGDSDLTDRDKKVSFVTTLGAACTKDVLLFACVALPGDPHQASAQLMSSASASPSRAANTFADAFEIEEDAEDDELQAMSEFGNEEKKKSFLEKLLLKKGWRPMQRVVNSIPYTLVVMLMIVFNAVVLAVDRLDSPPKLDEFVTLASYILSILFIVDAVLKVVGLGPSYFAQGMNVFDFILCVISIPDIINGRNSSFSALRAFRLVRLLRLAHRWDELQLHLRCLIGCILSVGSLCLLGFIVIYIYAILGFQLFGYDLADQRFSFRTVFDSLLTVFIGVTGENINTVADAVIHRTGLWAAVYFLSLTLLGNFLFTTMFVAVILENFNEGVQEDKRRKEQSEHFKAIAEASTHHGFGEAVRAAQRKFMKRRVVLEPDNDLNYDSDMEDDLGRWEAETDSGSDDAAGPSSTTGAEDGHATAGPLAASQSRPRADEGGMAVFAPVNYDDESPTSQHSSAGRRASTGSAGGVGPDGISPLRHSRRGSHRRTSLESHDPYMAVELRRTAAVEEAPPLSQQMLCHRAAQQIEQNLGIRGMTSILEQFVQDAKLHKGSHIVGDCATLATATEVQVASIRQERDRLIQASKISFAARYAVQQLARLKRQRQDHLANDDAPTSVLHVATFSRMGWRKTLAEKNSTEQQWRGRTSTSLICSIGPSNHTRRAFGDFLKHPASGWALLCVTVISSVLLALDNDRVYRKHPALEQIVEISDIVFVTIFWGEMLVKIVVLGVYQHPGAYFRSVWNSLDAVVTVTSLVALFYSPFKVFRALRVLRLLNLSFPLRVIVSSLVTSLPGLASVFVLLAILFLVYGVLGVALFQGYLRECNDPTVNTRSNCTGNFTVFVHDAFVSWPVVTPRLWLRSSRSTSFDSIEDALYTLFKLANSDGWFAVMYPIVDSLNRDETGKRNASPITALYFISFIVFANFCAVKLFIGVMVEKFVANREKCQGHSLLTEAQRQWILVQKVEMRVDVQGPPVRPSNPVFSMAFTLAMSPWFDRFFSLLIIANSVMISSYYETMSAGTRNTLDSVSAAFVALFAVELLVKIMAFGPLLFWRSQWNRLDFVVVLLSIAGLVIGNEAAVVRVFRVSRLLLLLRKMKGIQTLLVTFYHSLPEFANVAFVLGVMYFIFAIVGVFLFGTLPKSGEFDDVTNFDDVGKAFITLYVMMTQESWAEITDGMALHSPYAYLYSVLFMIIVSWIFVNLLVTVVCDVFGEAEETERLDSSLGVLDQFRDRWVLDDPKGSKLLPSHIVIKLLATLPNSVWERSHRVTAFLAILQQLTRLHIPIDANAMVRYEDCVASIALRLFSISVFEGINVSQRTVHGVHWKTQHFSVHHQFAAKLLTRRIRMYLNTRRERQLEVQLRLLREEHAAFVELELTPLRKSHQEAMLLASWLAYKLKKDERKKQRQLSQ